MRAYEIFLNGKRLCVAGIGKDGCISAYITYISEGDKTDIDIVGMVAPKRIYVRWARRRLSTGDEVRIKILDRKSVAKFKKIGRVDTPQQIIESQKRMVRKMAKGFGWEIRENRKAN